jgi:hypothetical protein
MQDMQAMEDRFTNVSTEIKIHLGELPTTDPYELRFLSNDKDRLVRAAVAQNHSTPQDTLAALSVDVHAYVRRSVAGNTSTPIGILNNLCVDDDFLVRHYVIQNPTWISHNKGKDGATNIAWILFRKQADGTLLFAGFTDNEAGFPPSDADQDPDLVLMQVESFEKIPPIHMAFTVKKT